MKKIILSLALGMLAIGAKAQSAMLRNFSCQAVSMVVTADVGCGAKYESTLIDVAPGLTIILDMYPGGANSPVNWFGSAPPAGSAFNLFKIMDGSFIWTNAVGKPCTGTAPVFGPQPGCGASAQFNYSNPSMVVVTVF